MNLSIGRYKMFFLFVIVLLNLNLFGQNVEVQSFTYESTTRDTVVEFPNVDHNNWERIWMLYSMRCKDGLVSPPISGQTNLGCGEWDYSCNTYIVDSTQVDSVKATASSHVIHGFSGDEFAYTENPTYSYYQSIQKEVVYTNTENEEEINLHQGSDQFAELSSSTPVSKQVYFTISLQELQNAGFTAGKISGLKLDILSGSGSFKNFRVEMNHFENIECVTPDDYQQVFFRDVQFDLSNNWIRFYEDFEWNGSDDLFVRFSFEDSSSDLVLNGKMIDVQNDSDFAATLDIEQNNFIHSSGGGHFTITEGLETIQEQITIAFWHFGDKVLPRNTTVLEGVDESNRRQVNVHLPWSNGQVYWDCGNDGSGYDRINKTAEESAYKNQWNHWVFTKNASTGSMKIYLNGSLFHSGTTLNRSINLTKLNVLTDKNQNNYAFSRIDDFAVWNSELSESDIQELNCVGLNSFSEYYDDVIAFFDFNNSDGDYLDDLSPLDNDTAVMDEAAIIKNRAFVLPSAPDFKELVPSITLVRGDYTKEVMDVVVVDSVLNTPYFTEFYSVQGTDLVVDSTKWYYPPGNQPIYNENLEIVDYNYVLADGLITPYTLNYFRKDAMRLEIMSFVTPYGINLDLGIEGKTWTFDVTDFAPILKGNKRIYLSRGGQWQEDMDIRFVFVEGIPSRPVRSLQQIWPVTSENYTTIQNDGKYEPRFLKRDEEDAYVVTKTTITGHGQQGEFIPRTHFLSYDGFKLPWQVWTECAENPIYPQGGTWVYDRAGWCPGAPSDTYVEDISFLFSTEQPLEIDYGVESGSGDSRYIVSSQLVKYGEANFNKDAAVEDIIYPSGKVEHGRFNPNCGKPKIVIKNNGQEELNQATITFGIEGKSSYEYQWEGFLDYLQTAEVTLDYIDDMTTSGDEQKFFARISTGDDEYESNNQLISTYTPVDQYGEDIVINFRTNSMNSETAYQVFDANDNLIHSRGPSGLFSNTNYVDTLFNLNGCYKIYVSDSDDDGLSWWANNDGDGYVRVRPVGGGVQKSIATDFGKFIDYNFVAGATSSIHELSDQVYVELYPNPTTDRIIFLAEGLENRINVKIFNELGMLVESRIFDGNGYYHEYLDVSELKSGIYFLKIEDKNNVAIERFVKH